MDSLHSTFLPILGSVLPSLQLPHTGIALDCASGTGHKLPLLHELLGPHMQLLALDHDQQALVHSKAPLSNRIVQHIVADAHQLPFASAHIAIAFCLAALGLFRDQDQALAELRRVLKPHACLILSLSEMRWCERIAWPNDLLQSIATAYQTSRHAWEQCLSASDDISADCHTLLIRAGFDAIHIRAFLLEAHLTPAHAELCLLPWQALRPHVAPRLSQPELLRCDECAATPELQLCPIVLLAKASA